jgi:NDP-sugar pyrophosphorylase family protein
MEPGDIKVIILAGGKGTRLAPYTTVLPKPLMPIGDMPILEVILRQLKHFGFSDITLAVGHLASLLEAYFGRGEKYGLKISYSYEDQPLGTAGPIALVDDLTDPFLVMNGDVLTSLDYRGIIEFHNRTGAVATIACCQKDVRINLGVLATGDGDRLLDYIEKPTLSYRVSMGIYLFGRRVLRFLNGADPADLPDLIKRLISNGQSISLYQFDGYWRDIGTVEDYEQAQREFESLKDALHLADCRHG